MSMFIDANVLLEMLLEGRSKPDAARKVIAAADRAIISPLTVHLYVHFGKKERHALPDLLEDMADYTIAPLAAAHVAWAAANRQGDDFEDALQVACAVLHGCKTFVTFDAALAENYGRFIRMKLL